MSSKKGVGSSRNGRDSNPKFLGIKKSGGQLSMSVLGETIPFLPRLTAELNLIREVKKAK
jgi:hypothetical protein